MGGLSRAFRRTTGAIMKFLPRHRDVVVAPPKQPVAVPKRRGLWHRGRLRRHLRARHLVATKRAQQRRSIRRERLARYAFPWRWAARRCQDQTLPVGVGRRVVAASGKTHVKMDDEERMLCGTSMFMIAGQSRRNRKHDRWCVVCRRVAEAVSYQVAQ